MNYDIILADPPWRYDFCKGGNREIERHYPTLSLSEIKEIFNQDWAHIGTSLFLWVPAPKLIWGIETIDAWGFKYVTCAVWDKEIIGMGMWFRQQHELLLVGRRKKSRLPTPDKRRSSVFRERRGKHSVKPKCVQEWIESAYPTETKLELFARYNRLGWDSWGDEV